MKVFAHRGVCSRTADENTLDAFCHAIEQCIHGIELDIRATRDGKVVVVHDVDLRRIAGCNKRVEGLTLKEIQGIVLRRGSSIPSLDDVTSCIPSPIEIDFEVKDQRVLSALITKLRTSTSLRKRSMISSFQKRVLTVAQRELPSVPRILLLKRWHVRSKRFERWLMKNNVSGVGLPSIAWTKKRVDWLNRCGVFAIAWEHYGLWSTKARARRLQRLGVRIVIANQPEKYREVFSV